MNRESLTVASAPVAPMIIDHVLEARPSRAPGYAAENEARLIPFTMLDEPVGTVWVLSHDDRRQFDAEDRRLLCSLAGFSSAAFTLRASLQSALDSAAKLGQAKQQLRRLAKGLA